MRGFVIGVVAVVLGCGVGGVGRPLGGGAAQGQEAGKQSTPLTPARKSGDTKNQPQKSAPLIVDATKEFHDFPHFGRFPVVKDYEAKAGDILVARFDRAVFATLSDYEKIANGNWTDKEFGIMHKDGGIISIKTMDQVKVLSDLEATEKTKKQRDNHPYQVEVMTGKFKGRTLFVDRKDFARIHDSGRAEFERKFGQTPPAEIQR